ncbi:MAG: hypothetical protein HC927_05850 [Deltaproteobacteria bacterium]|nr:hypothetical protein [Deltaproteobacteria bacterium]
MIRVYGGRERELHEGERVLVGDRLWFEFVNHSRFEIPRLYINVIERGVAGRLAVLNHGHQPAGLELPAQGGSRRMYWREGAIAGRAQTWPAQVPDHEPRTVTLSFIASVLPLDLRSLAGVAGQGSVIPRDSDEPTGEAPGFCWSYRRLSFTLCP